MTAVAAEEQTDDAGAYLPTPGFVLDQKAGHRTSRALGYPMHPVPDDWVSSMALDLEQVRERLMSTTGTRTNIESG